MFYILRGKESTNYSYKYKVNNLKFIVIYFSYLLYKYRNIEYLGSEKK